MCVCVCLILPSYDPLWNVIFVSLFFLEIKNAQTEERMQAIGIFNKNMLSRSLDFDIETA